MNVKNRTLLVVSLVILSLCAFFLAKGISHYDEEIDHTIQEQERLIDGIASDIRHHSFDSYLFKIRHLVRNNPEIVQALADRDRNRLLSLSLPHYQYLHGENPYFHAMAFNLPDGTVFLRVQKPELFGDNIGASRPLIAEVHRSREQRAGFDVGKHGAIYWVAQPVMHQGEYQGLVEFGIEVRQLETALAASLKSEVTTALKANQWQKADLAREGFQVHGDHVLLTRGNTLFDRIAATLDFSRLQDQRMVLGGKPYILHSCTLLPDFRKETIGRIILFQDISGQVLRKRTFILHTLLLTGALLALAFFVLYYSFDGLIGRLEEYARENRRAKEELQAGHDRLEDRVKARTVELAKSNARLADEVAIRRRTEARLDEQRAFLETIIESMTNPFYVIDAESYAVVMANRAALALGSSDSLAGLTCYRLTHHAEAPCDAEDHPCPLTEVKRTGRPVTLEHVHCDHSGAQRIMEIYAYPIFDASGRVAQVVEYTQDITERRNFEAEKEKLRSQLIASQKMEAVGVLAGGVAHDFNNILTVILGYSQIMALSFAETDPVREMVGEIYDAAEKAAGLTQQLLAFSRRQLMEIKVVNPNAIVGNISRMLGRLIGEDVRMQIALTEAIGNISADAGQIQQVIMNLVINARDAMPGGGNLTIETGQIELDERFVASRPGLAPGLYAMITVTDTGVGMTPEVREQIFEPFFTTKKRGEGTGLGLSTAYGIVRQHNGHINVYSEPGRGTTFKIYLPVVGGRPEEAEPHESRSMPPGRETILIVDDDASIRRLLRDTLEPLGYELLEAGSGEDALAVLERSDRPVDLVLTDLIMPGMNGRELIDILKADRREIRCILMSGYTDSILVRHNVLRAEVNFINKPLLPIALANRVREVLDEEGPARNNGATDAAHRRFARQKQPVEGNHGKNELLGIPSL